MSEPKYIRKWGLSPSNIEKFEQCPAKFEGYTLKKLVPYKETDSMKWGTEVHKALEDHVKTGEVLPSYLKHMIPIIDGLRNSGFQLYAEIQMSVNKLWEACGWWDRDCMVRGKVDLFAIKRETLEAYVIDYKTGKRYVPKTTGKHDDSQLNLYGAMALSALGLKRVIPWYLWLKSRESDKIIIDASNVQPIKDDFSRRIAVIDEAYRTGTFPTKSSPLCAYCPFIETCDGGVLYRSKARFIRGNRQT